jgi:hypothetical protein
MPVKGHTIGTFYERVWGCGRNTLKLAIRYYGKVGRGCFGVRVSVPLSVLMHSISRFFFWAK